jgi:hypothetical protein
LPLALEALFEISLGSRFAIARLDDNRIYYSVPSRLIGEQLEARITGTTIEILHKGAHVARQLLQQSLVGSPSRPDYQQIWVV